EDRARILALVRGLSLCRTVELYRGYGSGTGSISLPVCDPWVWSCDPRELSAWFRSGLRLSSSRSLRARCGRPTSLSSVSFWFLVLSMQVTCALRRCQAGLVRAHGCARSGLADQLGATDESAISSTTESANASARNGLS